MAERFDAAVRRRYTGEGAALAELIPEIFKCHALLKSAQDRLARDTGSNSARWRLLETIALSGKPQSVARLARTLRLTRQSVQVLVNDLEKKGYLSFARDGRKPRAKGVVLTAEGVARHRSAARRQVAWANRIADGFEAKVMADAARVLGALVKRLAAAEAQTAPRPTERCGFSAKARDTQTARET